MYLGVNSDDVVVLQAKVARNTVEIVTGGSRIAHSIIGTGVAIVCTSDRK